MTPDLVRVLATLVVVLAMKAASPGDSVARLDEHRARQYQDDGLPSLLWPSDPFQFEPGEYLVEGLLEPGSLIVLYGDSGCGKSTLAIDIGMAIARGATWRGRRTRRGLVIHIAGEGARGVRMRQAAHCQHYDVPRTVPYAVLPAAVQLGPEATTRELVPMILRAGADMGEVPAVIIVDTVARCLLGSENKDEDMGRFIRACDQLREETGAALVLVHHAGKDPARGARGHSSLRAAADTELLVEGAGNPRALTVTKQRDIETAPAMAFNLEPAVLSRDEETGQQVTACYVAHDEQPVVRKSKAVGRNQQVAVTALREWSRSNPDADLISSETIRSLLSAQGISRQRRHEVLESLVKVRVLTESVGGYTFDAKML